MDSRATAATAPAQQHSRDAAILNHLTDLFIAGAERFAEPDIAGFDDILTQLIGRIEVEARVLLAERLAPISNAPPNAMRLLAGDDAIVVARPVLSQSTRLDDGFLIETARTKSPQHLLAIASRPSLSAAVADVLIARGDRHIMLATARNRGARISHGGFGVLVARSVGDDELAETVGARADMPPELLRKLVAAASDAVRQKLRAAYPHAHAVVDQAVAEAAERVGGALQHDILDIAGAEPEVQTLHDAGTLDAATLAAFATDGRLAHLAVGLALICELPIAAAAHAMTEAGPQTALVLARAAGLPWTAVRQMLRHRPGGISAADLDQCLAAFERLKPETARQIVQFHRLRADIPVTARA